MRLATPPLAYFYLRSAGDRELAAIRAELAAADPDWRMPDLFAARNARLQQLQSNSADTAVEAVRLLPEGWDRTDDNKNPWPGDSPVNRLPPADEAARLKALRVRIEPAMAVARRLRDQPDGGTVVVVPDYSTYMLNINLTAVQERRQVAHALSIDSALAAEGGDPAGAVRSAHAGLNLARSIGDEPFLISQLVRIACTSIAVRSAERAVALGEPTDGVAELQAAFTREAGEGVMRHGLRGELASADQIMQNLRDGTVGGGGAGLPSGTTVSPFFPHDHAFTLRLLRRGLVEQGSPAHTRRTGEAMDAELKAEPAYRVPLTRLLAPAVDKCMSAGTRTEAMLLTAAVGLACERHRRAAGRWPESLAELPKELLAAVPADPYDGQPLRYKRTADGAVVYAVGENRKDDGGQAVVGTDRLADIVFRLYDPAKRRLPALPPTADDAP